MFVILHRDLRPQDRLESGGAGRPAEAHGPAQVVVVGERQRRDPELGRPLDQDLRRGRAVEQGKGRMAVQFGVRIVHSGTRRKNRR